MTTTEVQRSTGGLGPGRVLRPRAKVLPEHARGHNRSLVLQTLFHRGAMSRADLSRETGLTRVTISDLVAEFIADDRQSIGDKDRVLLIIEDDPAFAAIS